MTEKSPRREITIPVEDLPNGEQMTCSDPMERYLSLLATTAAIQEISRVTRVMSEAARQEARWVRQTVRTVREDLEDRATNR